MGQSFVRVNQSASARKKGSVYVKSRESLFRRDAIEIDVGSNAFRERRLGRAPGTELLEAGASARDAPVRPRCTDGTQTYAGRRRTASRVPRDESLRALDILFGGTSACAVDGTRMTESARAYGSRKGGSTANALGVPQTGGVRQSQPRGAHAFPHGGAAVGAVARHGRVWSCEAEKRKRLLLERDARCAVW
jgi:hypothetical protein